MNRDLVKSLNWNGIFKLNYQKIKLEFASTDHFSIPLWCNGYGNNLNILKFLKLGWLILKGIIKEVVALQVQK